MKIVIIRHGITRSNRVKAYSGSTNEHVLPEGLEEARHLASLGLYPDIDLLFITPLIRTRETAQILYPDKKGIVIDGLREMSFGNFEGQTFEMLKDNPVYQAWVDSGGTLPFPGGEDMLGFQKRCAAAFTETMQRPEVTALPDDAVVGFVVHGGTIMATLSALGIPKREYFDYMSDNCNGYRGVYKEGHLYDLERLFDSSQYKKEKPDHEWLRPKH